MTLSNGIPIKNVYYMLSYAFNQLQRNNYERIASEEFEHIYDLYAEILTRGIAHVLKRGLHKEYVSRTESLSTLKGQIDIMGTIRARMMQSGKLVCNHDELSIDNLYNQILLTTARLLLKQPDVAQQRKAELRRELLFFKGVNEVNLKNVRWSNLTYNQNSKPYQMLHGICHFITKGLLHTTEKGVHYLPHFSEDDMSELFEHFVLEYYKTHYPEYKAEARGIEWNLRDVSGYKHLIPKMKTDISLTINQLKLIIDTKFYSSPLDTNVDGEPKLDPENLYQIYAYVMNEDTKRRGRVHGMLLYAKTLHNAAPNMEMTLPDGNIIMVRSLDLSQDWSSITQQLDGFIAPFIRC